MPCVVTDLDVLPACGFQASYAQPRNVKQYTGYKQVHQSKVFPKDKTWFSNGKKADKGNPVIDENVSGGSAFMNIFIDHRESCH